MIEWSELLGHVGSNMPGQGKSKHKFHKARLSLTWLWPRKTGVGRRWGQGNNKEGRPPGPCICHRIVFAFTVWACVFRERVEVLSRWLLWSELGHKRITVDTVLRRACVGRWVARWKEIKRNPLGAFLIEKWWDSEHGSSSGDVERWSNL